MQFLVSLIGALAAAVGSGVLLARSFRVPRGDVIAWSVALLGLLVSLGSQAMGYLAGFDAAIFRAMELFGQVVAPLAMAVALSEVGGRGLAARFCARLYLGALGLVALVVLASDPLTTAHFSKAWPAPSVFYQTPPGIVLMAGIGPLTALVALIAVASVLARSGQPGWREAAGGQLAGGVGALALAYPGLAQLASQELHTRLPLAGLFTTLCLIAAVAATAAGVLGSSLPLAQMHGQDGREAGGDSGSGRAPRPARRREPGWDYPSRVTRAREPALAASTSRHARSDDDGQLAAGPARAARPGRPARPAQSDLFGQITIYTVADDALDDFDRLTRRCVAMAREREPDTLVYIAHGVPSAPEQRIIYQVFRSRAAYQRHLSQPYIRQFEQDHRPLVVSTNVVELGLQQAAVAPFPSVTELFGDGFDTSGFERPDYLRDYGRDPETTPAGHAGAGAPGAGSAGLASTDSGGWEPW